MTTIESTKSGDHTGEQGSFNRTRSATTSLRPGEAQDQSSLASKTDGNSSAPAATPSSLAPSSSAQSPSSSQSAPAPGRRSSRRPAIETDTDEVLVDRIRSGDRPAFDEIYARYFKRVFAFLDKRLRNRADTEEATQEVFINIFSSLDSFRGDAPFAAWMFGLTRRTLAARFRRKRHPTVPLFEEDEDQNYASLTAGGVPEASPLENYELNERAAQMTHVLENEVTAEQRMLFELHHLQSVPISEIAETLSKSEDSVKSNLYRTRKLLLR